MEKELEQLNRKLAKWGGFIYFQTNSGWVWVYPDGETQNIGPPKFPESLDACFKWLVPKFPVGIRLRMLGQLRNGKGYFCSIGGRHIAHHYEEAETPALALCKAIEKLIGEEE